MLYPYDMWYHPPGKYILRESIIKLSAKVDLVKLSVHSLPIV